MCSRNIWIARNDIDFSQGTFSVSQILKKADCDFVLCLENFSGNYDIQDSIVQTWSPPDYPFIKINVDATFIPNKGAAGAVAQDENGRFLGCASTTFDCTSSLLEETIACRLGVEFGLNNNFSRIIIEGDATNVTAAVQGDMWDIP
ncbi:uncharacterized protein LOC113352860 [Papaver somniferum]|uniref:uncharacterized protein LOC113352860 n=1 Tax=Papaver somniferum TaxID=3469 RepID=UPI000E6F4D7B|nr:uncharacterized protein LOC113352860 [Papaver somniferum]